MGALKEKHNRVKMGLLLFDLIFFVPASGTLNAPSILLLSILNLFFPPYHSVLFYDRMPCMVFSASIMPQQKVM